MFKPSSRLEEGFLWSIFYVFLHMVNEYKSILEGIGDFDTSIRSSKKQKVWENAFDMYKKETGKRLRLGCSSCRRTVYNWFNAKLKSFEDA